MTAAPRSLAATDAAARELAATWPPLTQEQADKVDALLAPYWPPPREAKAA